MIPGAASALYGPNAIQGILLMRSKSPFDYQGLDLYSKFGVTHVDEEDHDMSLYKDFGVRYAKAFNNKFAFKLNASWIQAQDFIAVDERDQSFVRNFNGTIENHLDANRANNRFYDGVNVYGDFSFPLSLAPSLNPALVPFTSLFPTGTDGLFSPTGFRERDFVDNTTESLKLGAALHYRLTDKIEVLGQYNIGIGSSVYTANDRFILDDFSIWTGKLELRGDNFFIRGYTTQENSGDSYAANTAVSLINQAYYLPDYILGFAGARTNGADITTAHAFARNYADNAQVNGLTAAEDLSGGGGRAAYAAGTPEFNRFFDQLRNTSIAEGGAKFLDKSALWHYEGSYNFKNEIDFADVVVGANFRTYALNSEGTLFALDNNGDEISFNEFGGYVQISKDIIDNVKLQGSVRYDKNENFDGQYSPRISGVWEFLSNQNLRASFQRGFRIPTTQDQYIDLDVQTRRLLGRNEVVTERYNLDRNTVYTTESVLAAQASGNVDDLVVASDVYKDFTTEKVNTWEVGYKGLLMDGRLLIDAFYYNSTYQDFGAEVDVTQAVVVGTDGSRILTNDGAIPAGWQTSNGVENHTKPVSSLLLCRPASWLTVIEIDAISGTEHDRNSLLRQ
ncbi:MAG: TonB-dependent receptor, partial [Bacteroidota bacterium]